MIKIRRWLLVMLVVVGVLFISSNVFAAEKDIATILKDFPKNWGKWGPNDEVGCLNYLTDAEVLRGVKAIKSGKVITIGSVIRGGAADPVWPGRHGADLMQTQSYQHYLSGALKPIGGGIMYADDFMNTFLHGVTHTDAMGHLWYGDKIWNGYSAKSTMGKMLKASVLPIAERGIVGRGVLLDVAKFKGVASLDPGMQITLQDILDTAKSENVTIEKHDVLIIRTGFLQLFFTKGADWFYKNFNEPGVTAEKALCEWLNKMEISFTASDTIAHEQTMSSVTGTAIPLHPWLLRDMGLGILEIADLEALSADCAKDGQYTFMFVAAPLKIAYATGAPTNPVCIK